jgi:hypothetical protein
MDKETQTFWDGFLKGVLASESTVNEAIVKNTLADVRIEEIQEALSNLRKKTERLHANDILYFLENV